MYDVLEYKFNKSECWFKDNCTNYGLDEKCNCACPIYCQYYYLVNLANIPKNKQYPQNLILDNPGKDQDQFEYLNHVKDNILDFVNKGCNLFLYSRYTGNGKTTWAIKLMSRYFSLIWSGNGLKCRGLYINVDEFLMGKQNNISVNDRRFKEMEKLIPYVDLVIWDDIGCTKLTKYQHSILYPLINSRIINGKANIFTSNVIDEELDENIGERLADRVFGTSEIVEFINPSQRTKTKRRVD